MAPSGVLVIHVTQGLSQYPATCTGEDNLCLPCPLLWKPLPWVLGLPGGSSEGVGHKGECPTWEGRKQTGQEVGLGNGSLSQIPKAGSLNKETQKGTLLPISLFHSQSKYRA